MAYCDYEFYTTKYHGDIIAEADFNRLSEKASDKLDQITFDRLIDGLPEDVRTAEKIKKAVCALAELISDMELAEQSGRDSTGYTKGADGLLKGKAIASLSAGGESISFVNNSQFGSIYQSMGNRDKENLIYETARQYLSGTGLLYAGV